MRLTTFALLTLCSASLAAQTPGPATPDTSVVRTLKSDLRNMVAAQESYYVDHHTYSGDVAALYFRTGHQPYRASAGVTVIVIDARDRGWNAVAVSAAAPGLRCAIWVGAPGAVIAPLNDGASEAMPTCKGP
jgi:hypothetical protein